MPINASVKDKAYVKKIMFGILSVCSWKNGEYLASIMDDSAIMCDEVIESYDKETKTVPKDFNEKS